MSSNSNAKKGNKNLRALFSVICVSIIALGLIVYFSTNTGNDPVNEVTTIEDTTQPVQKSVTVEDTTAEDTTEQTETQTVPESTSMALLDTNTPYKSFYKYPITEAVCSGYTEELVYNQTMGDYRSHTAVDFKGEAGTAVYAINDGIVLDVYNDSMLGMVIEIDHGGKLVAKYCGLDIVNVSKGDPVMIGATLGTLGKVPYEAAGESHLHFETKLDGSSVNPLDVMGKTE